MSAHFAECVSQLSEMKAWTCTGGVRNAEEEYPAGPPVNPLTRREGSHIRLRELITNDRFICHSPAGIPDVMASLPHA